MIDYEDLVVVIGKLARLWSEGTQFYDCFHSEFMNTSGTLKRSTRKFYC